MTAFTDDEALAWAEEKATDLANGSYFMEGVKLHTLVEHTKQLRKAVLSFGNGEGFDWAVLGRIDDLESEVERLRQLVTDTRDAMKLMIGMDLRYPWDTIPEEDVDSWIERIQKLKTTEAT